jgi:DNA polymerase V
MDVLDRINGKYRRGTIYPAYEGTDRSWSVRRRFKSPNYTGDWNELPVVS